MTTTDFIKAYEAFVLDGRLSKFSAEQYKSYLKNTCKKLPGISTHLDMISASGDADEQAVYAEQINAALTSALKDDSFPLKKKTLRNYKSAAAMLVAFLAELDSEKKKSKITVSLTGASEYTRNDIRKIFLARVRTQDRMSYSYGVFAARVLSRIATARKVKLFGKMIDNVKFLISSDGNNFIRLKKVDSLIIAADKHAYITSGGQTYPVYTQVVKDGKSTGYEIATVKSMRDLSLDHDSPLYYALETALPAMPEYGKLSASFKSFKDANGKMTAAHLSTQYFEKVFPALKLCESTILKETGAFLDGTQMTVMLKSYNSSKNKNNP
ncbi:MAG: hypothetical protein IJW79_11810 [Clostridia bacterium]|nr:hypothetical protein [Clostridia bacterium]